MSRADERVDEIALPIGLHEHIIGREAIVFIALQSAHHAEHLRRAGTREILKPFTVFVLAIQRHARSEFQCATIEAQRMAHAQICTTKIARQIDQTARVGGRALRRSGDGLELRDIARTVIGHRVNA